MIKARKTVALGDLGKSEITKDESGLFTIHNSGAISTFRIEQGKVVLVGAALHHLAIYGLSCGLEIGYARAHMQRGIQKCMKVRG